MTAHDVNEAIVKKRSSNWWNSFWGNLVVPNKSMDVLFYIVTPLQGTYPEDTAPIMTKNMHKDIHNSIICNYNILKTI